MGYILHYALGFAVLAIVIWVPGHLLDRLFSRHPEWPGGDPLVRFTLGIGAWIAAVFVAAGVGILHAPLFRILAAASLLGAAILLWRRRPWRLPKFGWSGAALAAIPLAAFAYVAWFVFLLALRPTPAWDANTYHLTVPRLYIEHGGFRPIFLNVYSNWPMNVDLLYGLGLMLDDYILASTVHFGFGLLALYGVVDCARRLSTEWAGAVAGALFLGSDLLLFEMGRAYVDVAFAFFFLQACVWTQRSFSDREHQRGWLLLGGLACGLLAGTKHTGVFGALALAALYLGHHVFEAWTAGSLRAGARSFAVAARRGLLFVALPAFLLVLPWYVKSAVYTGNPVYPFLYEVFGGVDWNPELSEQHAAWHRSYGTGALRWDLPLIVFSERADQFRKLYGRWEAFWTVLLPFTILVGFGRRPIFSLLVAATTYFWLWGAASQQMRFLLAILPLLAVSAALALARLGDRVLPARLRGWGGGIAVVVALKLMFGAATARVAEGRMWLQRYLREGEQVRRTDESTRWEAVNARVPPDGRILLVNNNYGFFSRRDYIADSFFEASQLAQLMEPYQSPETLFAFLRGMNVTHVLSQRAFWGIRFPAALPAMLGDPRFARPVFATASGDYTLYELSGGARLAEGDTPG